MVGVLTGAQGGPGTTREEGEAEGTVATLPTTVSANRPQGEAYEFEGWG